MIPPSNIKKKPGNVDCKFKNQRKVIGIIFIFYVIVLNISDLYLKWDIFNKNMTAAISNRTIITEDPITNEANDLKNFTNTHLIELSDKFIINVPDCNYNCCITAYLLILHIFFFSYTKKIFLI